MAGYTFAFDQNDSVMFPNFGKSVMLKWIKTAICRFIGCCQKGVFQSAVSIVLFPEKEVMVGGTIALKPSVVYIFNACFTRMLVV